MTAYQIVMGLLLLGSVWLQLRDARAAAKLGARGRVAWAIFGLAVPVGLIIWTLSLHIC